MLCQCRVDRKVLLAFKNRASYIQDGRTATHQMLHFIYIFSANISTKYFKHAAHSPFFSSKCRLFHNATFFGPCIIPVLHTGCAKIWMWNSGAKRLSSENFPFSPAAVFHLPLPQVNHSNAYHKAVITRIRMNTVARWLRCYDMTLWGSALCASGEQYRDFTPNLAVFYMEETEFLPQYYLVQTSSLCSGHDLHIGHWIIECVLTIPPPQTTGFIYLFAIGFKTLRSWCT